MPVDASLRPVLFIPQGMSRAKIIEFDKMSAHFEKVVRHSLEKLEGLSSNALPVISCRPGVGPIMRRWKEQGRPFVYRDRGYAVRGGATWLRKPSGDDGYFRWHLNSTQMTKIRDVPDDRWKALGIEPRPWATKGKHIVVAATSPTYDEFHDTFGWVQQTVKKLRKYTDRPIKVREKASRIPLKHHLKGAHCLVTHGSNAAVEAVILGCPVFVHPDSAAALVGLTDIGQIEAPVYPARQSWLNSLAYSQFTERELVDGTLWRFLE